MNKLLVATGGTKGIGRAVLEKFMANGFDAVTCARNREDLRQLKAGLTGSGTVNTFQADISDKNHVDAFVEFIQSLQRPVDVLVNNAGYFIPGAIATEPDGNLEEMMRVHLFSAYYLIRGLAGDMKKNQSGHIFNMCSVASIKAYPNGGSYAIAKTALYGLTRCLRDELKDYGVRVTAVIPGATKTGSWDGVDLPADRFMKVEDVADMIYASYAISPQSVVEDIIMRSQLGDI